VTINVGGIVRLTYAVKDDTGAVINPTTRTLTITQPDGTTAPGVVVPAPTTTGQLVYDFAPTQAGLHSVLWATTGPMTSDADVFTVEALGAQLVSVDEAVAHLRAAGTITSTPDREQMQWLCLVATEAVEGDLDRYLVRRTVTATGSTSGAISLKGPVLAVTSVSVNGGAAINPTLYSLAGGRLSSTHRWGGLPGTVTVTYEAGYPNPPRVTRLVALGTVQALWQTSQVAFHPGLDEGVDVGSDVAASVAGLPDALRSAYESLRSYAIA